MGCRRRLRAIRKRFRKIFACFYGRCTCCRPTEVGATTPKEVIDSGKELHRRFTIAGDFGCFAASLPKNIDWSKIRLPPKMDRRSESAKFAFLHQKIRPGMLNALLSFHSSTFSLDTASTSSGFVEQLSKTNQSAVLYDDPADHLKGTCGAEEWGRHLFPTATRFGIGSYADSSKAVTSLDIDDYNSDVRLINVTPRYSNGARVLNPQVFSFTRPSPNKLVVIGAGVSGKVLAGSLKLLDGSTIQACIKDYMRKDSTKAEHEYLAYTELYTTGFVPQAYGLVALSDRSGNRRSYGLVLEYLSYSVRMSCLCDIREFSPLFVVRTALLIILAVKRIHAAGILLNDITLDNILIDPRIRDHPRVHMIDFEKSSTLDGRGHPRIVKYEEREETPQIAPEVLDGGITTESSDVYSVGNALLFLVCNTRTTSTSEAIDLVFELGSKMTSDDPQKRMEVWSDALRLLRLSIQWLLLESEDE